MFFSPFGLLGGILSFAGAAINVAWGVTKMAAKATTKAVKGAIRVGRYLYKHGKPLGRKVIKTIKSCSGAVLSSIKSPQKSHVFTKPEPSSGQSPSLRSQAAKAISSRTAAGDKPVVRTAASTANTPPNEETVTGARIRNVADSVKRSNVFAESGSTEQTKPSAATSKANSTASKVASGAAKAAVLGATVVAPEVVVATKAGVKTAKVAARVGKGVLRRAKVLTDAVDKPPSPDNKKK